MKLWVVLHQVTPQKMIHICQVKHFLKNILGYLNVMLRHFVLIIHCNIYSHYKCAMLSGLQRCDGFHRTVMHQAVITARSVSFKTMGLNPKPWARTQSHGQGFKTTGLDPKQWAWTQSHGQGPKTMGLDPKPSAGTQNYGQGPKKMGMDPKLWAWTQSHGQGPKNMDLDPKPRAWTQSHGQGPKTMGLDPKPWAGTQNYGHGPKTMGMDPNPWACTYNGWGRGRRGITKHIMVTCVTAEYNAAYINPQ